MKRHGLGDERDFGAAPVMLLEKQDLPAAATLPQIWALHFTLILVKFFERLERGANKSGMARKD